MRKISKYMYMSAFEWQQHHKKNAFKVLLRSKNIYFFFGFRNFVYKTIAMEILGLNFEKTVYSNYNFPI